MTPLQIEILLHYHSRTIDYRRGDFSAPAVSEAIHDFRADGFLVDDADPTMERTYTLGERGKVYVQALCELPAPIAAWKMP